MVLEKASKKALRGAVVCMGPLRCRTEARVAGGREGRQERRTGRSWWPRRHECGLCTTGKFT